MKRTTKAETLGRRLRFFYRHVERARLLLYLVEGTLPLEIVQRTDFGNHEAVLRMQKRLKGLGVFRRLQELGAQEGDTVRCTIEAQGYEVFLISAYTGEGLEALLARLAQRVAELPPPEPLIEPAPEVAKPVRQPTRVYKDGEVFVVEGALPLEIVQRTDFGNHEAILRMQKRLKGLGVFRRLQELGAQEGDTVRIGDVELEYVPDV